MAEETPNPDQAAPDEEDDDEQQTLDDLTVMTDGDAVDADGETTGAVGGEAEPEDRTLGTIHAGSQTTEHELMDNLAPQQSPVIEIPDIAESEVHDRGIQVDGLQTTTTDADTESQGETVDAGGSRSFGPGDGPQGPGTGREPGGAGGVAGRGRTDAPTEPDGGDGDGGGDEEIIVAADGAASEGQITEVPPGAPTPDTTPPQTPAQQATPVTPPAAAPSAPPPAPPPAPRNVAPESEPAPPPPPPPANVAPVAGADTATTDEDTGVTINVLANDTDADGGTLSVTGATLPAGVDGTVVVNADGTVSFTPGTGFDALGVGDTQDVAITYTISDGQGGTSTSTATVTVTGSNDGPVASADTVTTNEDTGVTINVLANDTDLDGDILSVTSATIPDGVDGTVVVNNDGTVSFTPGAGFDALGVGEAQDVEITYTISDGQGGTSTATATVTVTGSNDGPVAVHDTAVTQETTGVTLNVLANDTDLDGDALTVTNVALPDGVDGTVTINADGTITFEPGPSFGTMVEGESQQVEIAYTISDGQGGTAAATATVTVTGSTTGIVTVVDTATTGEDASVTIDVLSNDVNLDGGELSVVEAVLPNGVDGTVVVNPDGTISFTPGSGFDALGVGETQDVAITYTATNAGGAIETGTATVTVTGSNDGPVATADVATTGEDSSVTLNVLANDTDVDVNDALTVTGASLPDGVDGTVVVNADGTISFTPGNEFDALGVGEMQDVAITYTISDGQGGTSTATATVTVTGSNDGPVATADVATTDE
ncbi:MAG: tandem-95 repeat protein, partial [Rhodospirillales bacterium]|nr:tandem-95 repeat protein [Rhodospirillales bacterium]